MPDDRIGTKCIDAQIDLIIADYFDMLALELRGAPLVKARRNAALQLVTGRSRGSIEFEHQNISAVLLRLGLSWIAGYKPIVNFQRALIDGVDRHLSARPAIFEAQPVEAAPAGLAESTPSYSRCRRCQTSIPCPRRWSVSCGNSIRR